MKENKNMDVIKVRNGFDLEDTVDLWKKFRNDKNIYYQLPSVKEISEFYQFLTEGGNFIYSTSLEDCEDKIKYWKYVSDQYNKHDFIMPFSPGMGYELRLEDIKKYYVSNKVLRQLKGIIKLLEEISVEFLEMDHVSFD